MLLMGFERGEGGGGQIFGFSIDSRRRSYNTLALYTVRVCDSALKYSMTLKTGSRVVQGH